MTAGSRSRALEEAGLVHSRPEAVTATLFDGRRAFFLPEDKVQVKYEMLRSHVVDGTPVTAAAARFARRGLAGLIAWPSPSRLSSLGSSAQPDRRGRRAPIPASTRWPPVMNCWSHRSRSPN